MLNLPDDSTPYRIVGIDPGTDTLGVSCLDLDLASNRLALVDARTFKASRMIRPLRRFAEVYGNRFARLRGLEDALLEYFASFQPHSIISESPYMGRFAATYAALTECMTTIRRSVCQYNPRMPLLTIDPASAKARLGVSGKSGDKTLMQDAVISANLENPHGIVLEGLDEHSIDSIAVAYYRATEILGLLP